MSTHVTTMKAWVTERMGTPAESLRLRHDWPIPKPRKGEVLVKVRACALNPGGFKIMKMAPNFLVGRPYVVEHDFVGTIVDGNETKFKPGDEVLGIVMPPVQIATKSGALAEYTTVPAVDLMRKPDDLTITQAAGMASAFWTGYQAVVEIAQLEKGQTVFINGASSCIGTMAIQVAKARGVRVVACASGRNEELVRSLGADEFFDYTTRPLHEQLRDKPPNPKFHAFIECVGLIDPSLYLHSPAYLVPGGPFITSGPLPSTLAMNDILLTSKLFFEAWMRPTWLGGVNRPYRMIRAHSSKPEYWEALGDMASKGQLTMPIDSEHNFEDVLPAYERIMSLHTKGKVVVHIG